MTHEERVEAKKEELSKHETLHTGNCYCEEDMRCSTETHLMSFLHTALTHEHEATLAEVAAEVKELQRQKVDFGKNPNMNMPYNQMLIGYANALEDILAFLHRKAEGKYCKEV